MSACPLFLRKGALMEILPDIARVPFSHLALVSGYAVTRDMSEYFKSEIVQKL